MLVKGVPGVFIDIKLYMSHKCIWLSMISYDICSGDDSILNNQRDTFMFAQIIVARGWFRIYQEMKYLLVLGNKCMRLEIQYSPIRYHFRPTRQVYTYRNHLQFNTINKDGNTYVVWETSGRCFITLGGSPNEFSLHLIFADGVMAHFVLEIRWRLRIGDAKPSSSFKHKLPYRSDSMDTSLRPRLTHVKRQDGRHVPDDILKCMLLNKFF